MSLLALTITIPRAATRVALADALARFLSSSADSWFRVRGIFGSDGATSWRLGHDGLAPRWPDEERDDGEAVSRCPGDLHQALVDALPERLAALDPDALEVAMVGAVSVQLDERGAPVWLGRWWPEDRGGVELARLHLAATVSELRLTITWPVFGIPLTALVLSSPRVSFGDPRVAQRNRARQLPAIAAALAAFGARADACAWSLDVELATEHHWVGDVDVARCLNEVWLPALRRGDATATTEPALDEDDGAFLAAALHGPLDARVDALRILGREPSADPRVMRALEVLTEDERPCVLQIPYRVGPVKLLAELALARSRRRRGEDDRTYLVCAVPLTSTEIERREIAAGLAVLAPPVGPTAPHAAILARYQRLHDLGVLDEVRRTITADTTLFELSPVDVEPAPSSARGPDAPPAVATVVGELDAGGTRRGWALEDLLTDPSDVPEVIDAVARALDDRTPCGLLGAYVGEHRLLAAAVLAAARHRRAELTPVEATYTPPMSASALRAARAAHHDRDTAPTADDFDGRLALFAWLRDRGALPEVRRALRHPVELAGLVAAG